MREFFISEEPETHRVFFETFLKKTFRNLCRKQSYYDCLVSMEKLDFVRGFIKNEEINYKLLIKYADSKHRKPLKESYKRGKRWEWQY